MVERPIACQAWQDDMATWLVAQVAPSREAAFQSHLEVCATCRQEADSLLGVAAVALTADPDGRDDVMVDPPSADLPDRIAAQVTSERRLHRVIRASVALVAVAACSLVVVLVVRPTSEARLDGTEVAFVVQPDGVVATAVVAADGPGSIVELTASGLEPGTTYALWLTPPDKSYEDRVPAGTFRTDGDGNVDQRLHSAIGVDDVGRVWVTDPEGDITLDTKAR